MATIVERAEELQKKHTPNKDWGDIRFGYIQGATDQRKIDIERLKEILDALMIDTRDKVAILTAMEE